jgi:hypothetical protein
VKASVASLDEMEHVEHALAALNVRYDRRYRCYEIAGRSVECVIAAMPVNIGEHADHALTQFARCSVTPDPSRQFEHFGRHHWTPIRRTPESLTESQGEIWETTMALRVRSIAPAA